MKKLSIILLAFIILNLSACSTLDKILPPYKATITSINVYDEFLTEELQVNDITPKRFLNVEADREITEDDFEFVVDNPSVATVKNIKINSGDIYYSIKGLSEGETYIYCKSGDINSDIIKVIVTTDTSAYDKILQGYIDSYPWDMSTEIFPNMQTSYLYAFNDNLSDIGYTYLDINNDGVTELLLGSMNINDNVVYDMFTLVNNEVVNVFNSGERYRYYLGSDGYIYFSGSSSAADTYYEKYKFNANIGKIECIEMVTYDGFYAEELGLVDDAFEGNECWFISKTGDKNDRVSISSNKATKITKNYEKKYKRPEYTPLSDYEYTN